MAGEHVACRTRSFVRVSRRLMYASSGSTTSACAAIALDDDGQRLVDVAERLIDDLLADAARERLGSNVGQPLGKWPAAPDPALAHAAVQPGHPERLRSQPTLERMIHHAQFTTRLRLAQCAAIGPAPERGRFISRTSGKIAKKTNPRSWNRPTNETIEAWCCTMPNSAA